MKRKFFSLLFFMMISFVCRAQQDSFTIDKHIDFLIYLYQNGQQDDFDFASEKLLARPNFNDDQRDSLNYIIGIVNFQKKKYYRSLSYLKNVSERSGFFYKSIFYLSVCHSENLHFDSAFAAISPLETGDAKNLFQLKMYELAAFSLMKRDYKAYDSLAAKFNSTDTLLSKEQQILISNQQQLKTLKRKSPLVAGTLSAIIPGLGLAYSGNNGQALAAFIRVAAMGALTLEDYIKLGPKNPQFIIFGSLFSFFYIGNIWGSALTVKIRYDEKIKEIDHNIMVGLRIPVDYFFR